MDVDLRVSDLLVPPYDGVASATRSSSPLGSARQTFGSSRAPTRRLLRERGGIEELIARCVLEVGAGERPLPGAARRSSLANLLLALDPQAEITIDAVCPSCGEPVSALVDAAGILLAELTDGDDRLLREVDALARTYHWSEAEILGLDVHRRRRYLELFAEEGDEL